MMLSVTDPRHEMDLAEGERVRFHDGPYGWRRGTVVGKASYTLWRIKADSDGIHEPGPVSIPERDICKIDG